MKSKESQVKADGKERKGKERKVDPKLGVDCVEQRIYSSC
jgi:hypothetical protein